MKWHRYLALTHLLLVNISFQKKMYTLYRTMGFLRSFTHFEQTIFKLVNYTQCIRLSMALRKVKERILINSGTVYIRMKTRTFSLANICDKLKETIRAFSAPY